MRKSNQQSIRAVIKRLLKNQKLEGRLQELDVLNNCEEVLGKNLMKYISNLSFREGILVIKMKSAVVRNELSYQKNEILKKINQKTAKANRLNTDIKTNQLDIGGLKEEIDKTNKSLSILLFEKKECNLDKTKLFSI